MFNFENIRPYSEQESMVAVKKLFTNPNFIQQLSIFQDQININEWVKEVLSCQTLFQFHLTFAYKVFLYYIKKSCTNIHYSGIENINPQKQYLFIGNHRDIILDSAIMQIYNFENGKEATLSAIGDNLVANQLFVELARVHKMFLVLRSGTLKEKITNTHLLSSYIYHSIFQEKESVWISQGNGRTKDGNDKTQQGLMKMLTLASPQNPIQTLLQMNITPVVVSYQYEPCAQMKARELALSENTPYIKQTGEDTQSIIEGMTGNKGEIHLVIGKPLQEKFDTIPPELSLNEKLAILCSLIDRQIHQNYYLFPQNFIAFDIQNHSEQFITRYSETEKKSFIEYLNEKSKVPDVSQEKMMKYLLDIYANPVINQLKAESRRQKAEGRINLL